MKSKTVAICFPISPSFATFYCVVSICLKRLWIWAWRVNISVVGGNAATFSPLVCRWGDSRVFSPGPRIGQGFIIWEISSCPCSISPLSTSPMMPKGRAPASSQELPEWGWMQHQTAFGTPAPDHKAFLNIWFGRKAAEVWNQSFPSLRWMALPGWRVPSTRFKHMYYEKVKSEDFSFLKNVRTTHCFRLRHILILLSTSVKKVSVPYCLKENIRKLFLPPKPTFLLDLSISVNKWRFIFFKQNIWIV